MLVKEILEEVMLQVHMVVVQVVEERALPVPMVQMVQEQAVVLVE
jgi:hypothetical protein